MSTAPRITNLRQRLQRAWGNDETGCTVLHIDMDAFYASLEVARDPRLVGKPVIIGTGNRSVVSAASYEARRHGINSAMPTAKARQLCPHGIFLPVDMPYYRRISHQIMTQVFAHITNCVEQVSVDEAYMDVKSALLQWKHPTAIAQWIRSEVRKQFGITCSVGIASNKLIAKLASTNAKPDGLLLVPQEHNVAFVQMMPLRAIGGIGARVQQKLKASGITSVVQLAQASHELLTDATNSPALAQTLHLAALGIDMRPVTPHTPEKSISTERTFARDTQDIQQIHDLLRHCCDEIASKLRHKRLLAKTVTVKLRYHNLQYATKSHTFEQSVDTASALIPQVISLFTAMSEQYRDEAKAEAEAALENTTATDSRTQTYGSILRPIRLAGVGVSGLSSAEQTVQQPTLDDIMQESEARNHTSRKTKLRHAEHALDKIRERYGHDAAQLGL